MKLAVLLLGVCAMVGSAWGAEVVKNGDKVAFMGDSITQNGWRYKDGYVRLVISGLKANDINIVPFPVGVSGHKSNQMLERVNRDVIAKKPDFMLLSCGVNDVWHGRGGNSLEAYSKNMTELVDKVQAAGIKPIILTATMIYEDPQNELNRKLAAYNDFLRQLAASRSLLLVDLSADMQNIIAEKAKNNIKAGTILTTDGVHMNPAGNQMMAKGILRGFGLNAEQIAKAEKSWQESPEKFPVQPRIDMTMAEYLKLEAIAEKHGKSVNDFIIDLIMKAN